MRTDLPDCLAMVDIRRYQTPGPQGIMGKKHYERGLMWVETFQAG
jgi:hypothetical protein